MLNKDEFCTMTIGHENTLNNTKDLLAQIGRKQIIGLYPNYTRPIHGSATTDVFFIALCTLLILILQEKAVKCFVYLQQIFIVYQ